MKSRRLTAKMVRGACLESRLECLEERFVEGKVERVITRGAGSDATAEEGEKGRLECTSRTC